MTDRDRDEFFYKLHTEYGEAKARQMLESREWGARERLVREWLHIQEQERLTETQKRENRAVEAAERSASAAQNSAQSAKDAARWAKWAALAAIATIIITIALHFM